MKKAIFLTLLLITASVSMQAKDIKVNTFRYAGPFTIKVPLMIDSTDVNSQKFNITSLLDSPLQLNLTENGRSFSDNEPIAANHTAALHLLQTNIQNESFTKASFNIEGLKNYQLFIDGEKSEGKEVKLMPGNHSVVVKCLTEADSTEHISMTMSTDDKANFTINGNNDRLYTITDVMQGEHIRSTSISPSGRYLITTRYNLMPDGSANWTYRLTDLQQNKIIVETTEALEWLPNEDRYYTIRKEKDGNQIIAHDITTGKQETIASQLTVNDFQILPLKTGKLLITETCEGPKDDVDVHEFIHPDDRQPGWRNRYNISILDTKTGIKQPITFGHRNTYACAVSEDGRKIIAMTSYSKLGKRPTERSKMQIVDIETMQSTTVYEEDGFVVSACFSPDGKQLLIKGSPEAFNGIGKNVPEGRIPSMFDYQLYIYNIASKTIIPITKNFNPSVNDFQWNGNDNTIYFTADNRDCVSLYRCLPNKNFAIEQIIIPEDVISSISLAKNAPKAVVLGESATNPERLYSLNLKSDKTQLIEDLSAKRLKGITLGECKAWDFVNSRGDTICGRYYLPPHFDASKQYPLIVYYYGGCSTTPRNFDTRYPHNTYAAQGYVVYVLQPSGCAGFGQEFSSRHVNTAGSGPADDIIEGTHQFVAEHPFIDGKHIGCMGASYGGFMTQYLQTQTDMFAAAISHAGISDHTSYWGEGYWGYTYSEVSMAESYPWTRKDLYVDQSPLFNADKIHTPLLFLHGTADTNVPIGESIQMYTALKLLGRPTAFVAVEGENHGINEYSKRLKWQQTIYAWFAKWLKEDSSWWDSMYPEKELF